MKIKIIIVIIFFISQTFCFSQYWSICDSSNIGSHYYITAYDSMTYIISGMENHGFHDSVFVYNTFMKITEDYGKSWRTIWQRDFDINKPINPPMIREIKFLSRKVILAVGFTGIYLRSEDGGLTWDSTAFDAEWSPQDMNFSDNKYGILYFEFQKLYYLTNDSGKTWISKILPLDQPRLKDGYALRTIHRFGKDTLILSCFNGATSAEVFTMKSVDEGEHWTVYNNVSDFISFQYFYDSNLGWAGGVKELNKNDTVVIYKTQNGGSDWVKVWQADDMFNAPIYFVIYNKNQIIATGPRKVLRSNDGGMSWSYDQTSEVYQNYTFSQIASTDINHGLMRTNKYIYRLDFAASVEPDKEIQNEISISPNPATDFLEIPYINRRVNPTVDNSNIKIFNVYGQNCDLTTKLSIIGEGVRIDISRLAPGMYFVRIGDRASKFVKM